MSNDIEQLQQTIEYFRKENQLLKERLFENGISYSDIEDANSVYANAEFDPNQGARIREFKINEKVAENFFSMFCRGRKDVYDLRYTNPKTGKKWILYTVP